MRMMVKSVILAGAGLLLAASPALADVKAGVDAWSRGDYATAVREWQSAADKGDADAQFNLGQAYRMGRGVAPDARKAELFYARAAEQGHLQAADNYGLMLFQDGRREMALPYIKTAAERGDPRAQYLLGIAHFNGDLVAKDWLRAYALMSLANGAGLPQAPPALAQMDQYIPLAQRQAATSLATKMQQDADATRARQLATVDLASPHPAATGGPARVPAPIQSVAVVPSSGSSASAALDATRATGTESPAEAGADYARPAVTAKPAAPAPRPAIAAVRPVPAPVAVARPAPKPLVKPAPAPAATTGPWRVQLGAFGVVGNAERLWGQIGGKGVLAGKGRILEPAGKLTKLYAGGFASQADAAAACETLKRGGQSCLVTR